MYFMVEFQIFCQIFSPTPLAEWLLGREGRLAAAVSRVEVEVDERLPVVEIAEVDVGRAVELVRAEGCRASTCRHMSTHLTHTTLKKQTVNYQDS